MSCSYKYEFSLLIQCSYSIAFSENLMLHTVHPVSVGVNFDQEAVCTISSLY